MNFRILYESRWTGGIRMVTIGTASLFAVFLATPVTQAQSQDALFRVNQLEEQVRQLNGKIEELNFLLLQMQEQIRRMREDNEFRFQDLENKKQGNLDGSTDEIGNKIAKNIKEKNTGEITENTRVKKIFRLEKPQPSEFPALGKNSDGELTQLPIIPKTVDGVEIYDGREQPADEEGTRREMPLGTITFDSLGNIVDTALGKPVDLTASLRNGGRTQTLPEESQQVSIGEQLDTIGTPKELFELGYDYFQSGDYYRSGKVFSRFVEQYPDDKKIASAQYWLGESLFSQRDFKGAAKIFLDTHTNWPDARIAPQALLKLGISLAGMEQRELACATYVKVGKKYPDIGNAMRGRILAEQKSAQCLN